MAEGEQSASARNFFLVLVFLHDFHSLSFITSTSSSSSSHAAQHVASHANRITQSKPSTTHVRITRQTREEERAADGPKRPRRARGAGSTVALSPSSSNMFSAVAWATSCAIPCWRRRISRVCERKERAINERLRRALKRRRWRRLVAPNKGWRRGEFGRVVCLLRCRERWPAHVPCACHVQKKRLENNSLVFFLFLFLRGAGGKTAKRAKDERRDRFSQAVCMSHVQTTARSPHRGLLAAGRARTYER